MRALLWLFLGITLPATSVHCYDYVVHERRRFEGDGWRRVSTLDRELVLPVRIALTQQNIQFADGYLMNVSDPKSPNYAKWWTADEVARKFAPSKEGVQKVVTWLNQSGIPTKNLFRSGNGGWLAFNATVDDMERLVKAQYAVFENAASAEHEVLSEEYSLPKEIRSFVDFVTPTTYFDDGLIMGLRKKNGTRPESPIPNLRPGKRKLDPEQQYLPVSQHVEATLQEQSTPRCDLAITLDCLRQLYNIPTDNMTHPNNTLGVVQFSQFSYRQADLDLFFHGYAPESYGRTPRVEGINGATIQTQNSSINMNGEANLDLEYAMGLTYPMTVTNYQLNRNLNDMLAAFDNTYCQYLHPYIDGIDPSTNKNYECGTRDPAKVISVSYAIDEVDYPILYQQRQCTEFLKLGLQGVTVIGASNDYGVAGSSNLCLSPVNGRANASDSGYFNPTSPANCPYVTAVGGTQLPVNGTALTREISLTLQYGSSWMSSGGGFSNLFPMPDYQAPHVQTYMSKQQNYLTGFARQFNSSGYARGIPDVSLNAANYLTAVVSKIWKSSGTSASAPVFAALIARVNDARLRAGKTTVGFLNPTLYANQWVFNDIYQGSNWGCGREGFRATDGWDPVTGLGTPDYVRMHDLFMGLP